MRVLVAESAPTRRSLLLAVAISAIVASGAGPARGAGSAAASARTANGSAHVAAAKWTPILTGADRTQGSAGFGRVRPSEIYLGGDESGLACHIHWAAWGGRFAVGVGTAWYVAPRRPVADGHWAPAVVVLYRLGRWRHRLAYTRYRWYFPEGGSLSGGGADDCLV
ncbi:MAG: hypothetical protein ACRDNJ_06355 [Solirubrobacteraceae bacterium]